MKDLLWTFQQELSRDGERQGMLHGVNSSGRMALGGVELHQCRNPQPHLAGAGFSHVPRRLRDRQKPVFARDSLAIRKAHTFRKGARTAFRG